MSQSLSHVRVLCLAGLMALALAACGRRGALEPPPDPSVPQAQGQTAGTATAADDDETDGLNTPGSTLPSPVGTPRRTGAARGYTIPKEPFILDPLL